MKTRVYGWHYLRLRLEERPANLEGAVEYYIPGPERRSWELRLGPVYICGFWRGGWLRLWQHGPGLVWSCAPPLFSERNGFVRVWFRIGKWRVRGLGR